MPEAAGFHPVTRSPEEREKAASFLRVVAPTAVKSPPAKSVLPVLVSVRTVLFMFGLNESSEASLVLRAANRLRVTPLIVVKVPPA